MKNAEDIKKMHVRLADGGLIELLYADEQRLTPIATFEVDRKNPLEDDWFEFIYKDEPYDLNIWSTFIQDDGEEMVAVVYEVILDGDNTATNVNDFIRIKIFS